MEISILGCGNMGRALAAKLGKANHLSFYDRNAEKSHLLEAAGYGNSYKNIKDSLDRSSVAILAVKPQNLKEIAQQIGKNVGKVKTIISLLAGTPIDKLKSYFSQVNIVRMMPNLPLIYGEGIIGLCSEELTSQIEYEFLTKLFKCLGKIYWLPERKFDALTALASSGPAFFLAIFEAMTQAGIQMGFSPEESKDLVSKMIQGSLTLLERSNKDPAELITQIASPKGTTMAGLEKLDEQAVKESIIHAFLASFQRAQQLPTDWKED